MPLKLHFLQRLKEWIRKNQKTVVFLVCLVLAALFWLLNSLSRNFETTLTRPLAYHHLPFSSDLNQGLPKEVTFHFRGSGFSLFHLHFRDQPDSIIVDLNGHKDDRTNVNTLSKQLITDLKPYKVDPGVILPGITYKNRKTVPVRATGDLQFRSRFAGAGPIILKPDSITISGPERELDKISEVKTESIHLRDIHQPMFGSVFLKKDLPSSLSLSDSYVYYYLAVEEFTEGIFSIPVELPPSQKGRINLMPPVVQVRFTVELKHYPKIKPSDFRVTATVPLDQMPSSVNAEITRRPKGITNVRIEPSSLNYLVKE